MLGAEIVELTAEASSQVSQQEAESHTLPDLMMMNHLVIEKFSDRPSDGPDTETFISQVKFACLSMSASPHGPSGVQRISSYRVETDFKAVSTAKRWSTQLNHATKRDYTLFTFLSWRRGRPGLGCLSSLFSCMVLVPGKGRSRLRSRTRKVLTSRALSSQSLGRRQPSSGVECCLAAGVP